MIQVRKFFLLFKQAAIFTFDSLLLTSEAMLTSTIDQLMTSFGKDEPEMNKEDLQNETNKEEYKDKGEFRGKEKDDETLDQKSDLLVCGVITTPTGKISVVRPRNALVQKDSDLNLGMAKLQFLAPRLFNGKLSLATVIAATRLLGFHISPSF